MKTVFLSLLILANASVAHAFLPQCTGAGTSEEGWTMPDGSVKSAKCAEQTAVCGAIGTRSEGWYAIPVGESKLVNWANCSESDADKPVCANVGTRSEGWQTTQGELYWDKCSEKAIACMAIGTRSEGWYAVTPDREKGGGLIFWDNCAHR